MTRAFKGKAGRWRVQAYERTPSGAGINRHQFGTALPDNPAASSTQLDQVVVGDWFHLEHMGGKNWWIDVAGVALNVTVGRDGKPKSVTVEYDERDGVVYR